MIAADVKKSINLNKTSSVVNSTEQEKTSTQNTQDIAQNLKEVEARLAQIRSQLELPSIKTDNSPTPESEQKTLCQSKKTKGFAAIKSFTKDLISASPKAKRWGVLTGVPIGAGFTLLTAGLVGAPITVGLGIGAGLGLVCGTINASRYDRYMASKPQAS